MFRPSTNASITEPALERRRQQGPLRALNIAQEKGRTVVDAALLI